MICYYERYEVQINECFVALISHNLDSFTSLLRGDRALFQIEAQLVKHSPLLQPPVQSIGTLLKRDPDHLLDRWVWICFILRQSNVYFKLSILDTKTYFKMRWRINLSR